MTYIYRQKKWRLRFRRDPDSGRVLFLGPLVINFDVVAGGRNMTPRQKRFLQLLAFILVMLFVCAYGVFRIALWGKGL